MIADPKFASVRPDLSFACHNLPGAPLGRVWLSEGPVNCASRGLRLRFHGRTAHDSTPEFGRSPAPALARLIRELPTLARGVFGDADFAFVTVTHARLGDPTFGVAPGEAELWATLRILTDATMRALCDAAERRASEAARAAGVALDIGYADVFAHCENAPQAVAALRRALDALGVSHEAGEPMRASEDFARFGALAPAAMFFLGAGERCPSLHAPDYDFPDDLIGVGAAIFARAAPDQLG